MGFLICQKNPTNLRLTPTHNLFIIIYMTEAELVINIVKGNLAWADPMSTVCLDQHERHPDKFPIGSTFQSFDEVLDDIISDLTMYRDERRIEASFQSANI